MEGDHRIPLILQAAVSGAIDFSKADFRRNDWWQKLTLILPEIQRQRQLDIYKCQLQHALAVIQLPKISEKSFDDFKEIVADIISKIVDTYANPFKPRTKTWREDTAARLEQAWKDQFGDPNDPEVAAAIDRTAEMLLSKLKPRSG